MFVEVNGVAGCYVVAAITSGIEKRAVCVRAFVSEKRVGLLEFRTIDNETTFRIEIPPSQAQLELIRQRFFQMDLHNSESGKVAVRAVNGPFNISTSSINSGIRLLSCPR